MNKLYWLIIILLVAGGMIWLVRPSSNGELDTFAQCLASKNITMYGAEWCSHCQNEKRGFGSSFKYVPYVECPNDIQQCVALGVQGYPTWIFPDGTRLEGEQGVETLSRVSGCPLYVQ